MTTDNEALKLSDWLLDFESDYDRTPTRQEIWDAAIQTGRDQLQKELAEMEPVAWANIELTGKSEHWNCVYFFKELAESSVNQNGGRLLKLIPQPNMPPIKEKEE